MENIKELYSETQEVKRNNLGMVRMMINVETGEIWNDYFLDENSFKIYIDKNITEIPVNSIIREASDHILSKEEIVKAIEKWVSEKCKNK